jgi:ATP-binding cassette subfamily B protein
MIVLVGENGAGKTTLAKLLCRLYDPTQGSIYWGKQDMRSLQINDLRSHIAVVMQDYARFPASLRQNVGWGFLPKLQDDKAIQQVLQESGIDYLVKELEQGLDTPLGKQLEDGVDLSGGQWQRVAIARALLRLSQAELLVFDEPTAALDPKNEHEIYNILKAIARGRMAVVVSHRLALAKMADRIIVLEHGRIVESGSHSEVMSNGNQYHTMFTRQASSYL